MKMSESNVRRTSLQKRFSVGPENADGLVILRRKGSVDPYADVTSSGGTNRPGDRVSKVESVSCDVMSGEPIRMMGYMEKRSKLLGWKKFWFVLDGHLLTYFKSKADYETLSPFAGSITLGNVSTVRPIQIKNCKGFPMQIVSRNQVYCLRCPEKTVLEEWVLALQETISIPPSISSPVWADPGAQFYRYSFAAVSDWSVTDSQGDISGSLSNLPKNFYLKRDKTEQYLPLKQKCQSFTNLPTETSFPHPDSPSASNRSICSAMSSGRQDPKMRYSASLVQLESSAQASELKRELASKLSIGHISPSSIRDKQQLEKIKLKISDDGSLKNKFGSNVSSDSSVKEDQQPPSRITEFLSANFKSTGAETPRATSALAAIAEGFEPNLKRRPHTLQLHSTNNDSEEFRNLKKKKGIGNLLQRIFKKELDQSSTTKKRQDRGMVISSPVDLRAQSQIILPDKLTPSPPKSNSPPIFEPHFPSKGVPIPKSSQFISELRKVQRRRSSSEDEPITPETPPTSPVVPPTPPPKTVDDNLSYNEKLAKFNRLSAQLGAIQLSPTSGGGISRSTSCRVKSYDDDEPPPLLPPKKSTLERKEKLPSAYDTPKNNQPVTGGTPLEDGSMIFIPQLATGSVPRERKISLSKLLCKKNSAPEITVGPDIFSLKEGGNCQSTEVTEIPNPEVKPGHTEQNRKSERTRFSSFESPAENVVDACSHTSEDWKSPSEITIEEQYYSTVSPEAIYEEIKYATQETILEELETVQEYGEEEDELYDEFVTPMTTYETKPDIDPISQSPVHDYNNVRFSGMAALQQYLDEEVTNDASNSLLLKVSDTGDAAVNRLGRSLAVHKLETLLK